MAGTLPVGQGTNPPNIDDEWDIDEWEYEYDDNETEDFFVTLDLTSHNSSTGRNKSKRRPVAPLQKRLRGHRRGPAQVDTAANPEQRSDSAPSLPLQILDLESSNPIVAYGSQAYSCDWTTTLGTDIIFSRDESTAIPQKSHKTTQSSAKSAMIAATPLRLVAHPARCKLREPRKEHNVPKGATPAANTVIPKPEEHGEAFAARASSDQANAESTVTPADRTDQAAAPTEQDNFFVHLNSIKARKGETDDARPVPNWILSKSGPKPQKRKRSPSPDSVTPLSPESIPTRLSSDHPRPFAPHPVTPTPSSTQAPFISAQSAQDPLSIPTRAATVSAETPAEQSIAAPADENPFPVPPTMIPSFATNSPPPYPRTIGDQGATYVSLPPAQRPARGPGSRGGKVRRSNHRPHAAHPPSSSTAPAYSAPSGGVGHQPQRRGGPSRQKTEQYTSPQALPQTMPPYHAPNDTPAPAQFTPSVSSAAPTSATPVPAPAAPASAATPPLWQFTDGISARRLAETPMQARDQQGRGRDLTSMAVQAPGGRSAADAIGLDDVVAGGAGGAGWGDVPRGSGGGRGGGGGYARTSAADKNSAGGAKFGDTGGDAAAGTGGTSGTFGVSDDGSDTYDEG